MVSRSLLKNNHTNVASTLLYIYMLDFVQDNWFSNLLWPSLAWNLLMLVGSMICLWLVSKYMTLMDFNCGRQEFWYNMHTCLSRNRETAERSPHLRLKMNPTSETLWQIFKHFHICLVGVHLWLVCRTKYNIIQYEWIIHIHSLKLR